ncbi:MAG: phosphate ABC transporter ATP-binding protein, partial [Bradyrhizobium sp.]
MISSFSKSHRTAAEPLPTPTPSRPAAAVADLPVKVQIRNVGFFYGKFQALKDVSLSLLDRRVTAFIGPSGCGKS